MSEDTTNIQLSNSLRNFSNCKLNNVQIDDHLLTIKQLVERYNTNLERGLTTVEAKKLLKQNGLNQLTPPKQTPEIVKFIKQLMGGFSLLLWFGAVLCMVAYFIEVAENGESASKDNLYLGIVLIVVVIVTGVFAYYQEAKSSAIMSSFKGLIPHQAYVLRDGSVKEIDPRFLVIGDVVEVNGGNQVPADLRIVESYGFKVDNSSITGESHPQSRGCSTNHQDALEADNLAFFSSYCTEGRARGVVIRVGDHTAIGQIAHLTHQPSGETTIAREIRHFIHLITVFAFTLGILFFILSLCIGYSWIEAVIFLIGVIVANVPEGLQATVTVCLSLSAKSMYKKNCLVKNLEAVETLGATSIICSDKTGTLTQNKMSVAHIWFNNQIYDTLGDMTILQEELNSSNRFEDFLRVGCLCNQAKHKEQFVDSNSQNGTNKAEFSGSASDIAILKLIESIAIDTSPIRAKYPIVSEVPFNSTNKFQLTVHHLTEKNASHKYLVCIKGAPERIVNQCESFVLNGHCLVLDGQAREIISNICTYFATKGERVLSFAEFYTNDVKILFEDESHSVPKHNIKCFTLLGLVSIIDPPRPDVSEAVAKCREAGIRVFMVTGDHPITAQAIAKSVGIISKPKKKRIVMDEKVYHKLFGTNKSISTESSYWDNSIVIPGDILSRLSSAQLDTVIDNFSEIVFARTSPEQKLSIVQSCQRLNNIVAVTGDGVNDSPALKRANIGISMGITGSDVSKEAADMILLDDHFATIVVGIEEGRVIFDNLKKSIAYVVASNFPEIIPFIFYVVFGFPLALGTITILCIDLGTDIFPSISLGYEKAESNIMRQKPRNPQTDHLVTMRLFNIAYFQIGMIQALAGFFTYFAVMADHGFFITDLFHIRSSWEAKEVVIIDQHGQFWTYNGRKVLEHRCQTAFFVSIVVCQWADLLICKTRRNSLLQQGMSNQVLNTSLVVETLIALFLCYCPGMPALLNLYPLKWWYWLLALPFAILTIAYDETRRWFIRYRPEGLFEIETYY